MPFVRPSRVSPVISGLLLTGLAACCVGAAALADETTTETANAAARWAAARIDDYSYTLTSRVMWGATSIILIEVKNGQLMAANHIIKRTNPVPEYAANEASGLRKTIDDLFADMISREDFVAANFDPEFGYPINIYYKNTDFPEALDQLEIRDFSVLNDGG